MRPLGVPSHPVIGQAAAVVRTEDARVSHDGLLTPSGYPGTLTSSLPRGLAGVALPADATERAARCAFGPLPESARRARDFTRVTLDEWGMADRVDVTELVVCELVTNALRHGLLSAAWTPEDRPIGLTLLRRDRDLICLVTDPESAGPVLVDVSASAEGGRGLQVVEACSAAWGWQPVEGLGKVVWALLRLPAARALRLPAATAAPGPAGPPGVHQPAQGAQESRSSNSPSFAPRTNASISARV
jgi:hypothetical protein